MIHLSDGEGHHLQARGSDMWFKALGADTDGRISLMERTLPPGGQMPPAHRHAANDEAYYVLDGEVTFRVEGEVVSGGSGTFLLVAAGEAHTFGNVRDNAARLLIVHAPGLDRYFDDLSALWSESEPPGREQELDLMRRHGMEPA